jgi:hypothetical protein
MMFFCEEGELSKNFRVLTTRARDARRIRIALPARIRAKERERLK